MAERVEQALRSAALWDEVKDKLKNSGLSLSGGQQQRLCIARAVATEPSVLLMDEPCSALDPIATRRIEELMLELKKNYTIAIVTHNMQQAQRVADITAFFSVDISKGGRTGYLVEIGPTAQIFENPQRAAHQGIRQRRSSAEPGSPTPVTAQRRPGAGMRAGRCSRRPAASPLGQEPRAARRRSCCAAPARPSPRRSTRSGSRTIGRQHPDVAIAYDAVGSGEGQRALPGRTRSTSAPATPP